jgi:lipoprotein-anchoring transpeptidase ErfK/SrfK
VSREADPAFARKVVTYPSRERPGTIVVDPGSHFLYLVQGGGQAIRYGVAVGSEGFGWSGVACAKRGVPISPIANSTADKL